MRLQTRLFLATALLVLALAATQWWLHQRQLRAVEAELGAVAASVGRDIISLGADVAVRPFDHGAYGMVWVNGKDSATEDGTVEVRRDVSVVVVPEGEEPELTHRIMTKKLQSAPDGTIIGEEQEYLVSAEQFEMELSEGSDAVAVLADASEVKRFVLQVVADDDDEGRFLVIRGDRGLSQRIPIPVEPAVQSFRSSMRHGAVVGGVVLMLGLAGAGVLANRVTRPLRGLADGAEAVGRGELGVQVPVTAGGEVGELQRSFNAMSLRLAELEAERDRWREREHLAQLGDVSRGLAHTLRNPLNTLGLAVEELALGAREGDELVLTARTQIRRIDQWLRSFLALGAENAAEPEESDLADLTRAVVFEAVQQGAPVEIDTDTEPIPVMVVASAVGAALTNLLDNAAAVSGDVGPVEVAVGREGEFGMVTIRDHGPGLPEDVRSRLFEPHVTTRVGGSGMGLYLARQLVVGMHRGTLDIEDHPGGGTIATVKLPLSFTDEASGA